MLLQRGIPQDRSARQLSNFMDLQELDNNREQSRSTRLEASRSKNGEQWKQHNMMKKVEKKRKRDAWLLQED
jgi:hypothetical protein